MNSILRWLDLAYDKHANARVVDSSTNKPAPVLPQYVALFFGVLVQPYFHKYSTTGTWGWSASVFWGWLVFAALTTLVIFPGVYRNAFDPVKPLFPQLCAIFVSGMGWQTLSETALKAGVAVINKS